MLHIGSRMTALLCCAGMLLSAVPLTAHAASAAPSGITDAELSDKISEFVADKPYAGFGAAVFHGDEILYTGYFGSTDVENDVPVSADSVFEWGSITKTLTWVSIMQLYEDGKIDLEEDIRTYLPEGFLKNLKYDEPITVLNLMNHNAGWADTTYAIFSESGHIPDELEDVLQEIEPAQVYPPGEITSYSNFGAALAGLIVEKVSGEDYTEYVWEHIFEPLGMEHTAIAADHSDNSYVQEEIEKLKGYDVSLKKDQTVTKCTVSENYYVRIAPAGAACGTLGDLTTYAQALADPDAPLFKNRATQEMMLSGSSYHADSDIPICCHGFWVQENAVRTYGHDGGTLACSTDMLFDPVSGYGVVTFANSRSSSELVYGLPNLIFGEPDPDSFTVSGEPSEKNMSGIYSLSRTTSKGLLKFASCLSLMALPAPDENGVYQVGELLQVTPLGGDLYLLKQNEMYSVISTHELSDGRQAVCIGSMELIRDNLLVVRLGLIAAYIIMSIVCLVRLIIKLIQIIRKKRYRYPGTIMNSMVQFMMLVSVITAFTAMALAGGCIKLTPVIGMIFGIVQILCALVYVISIVMQIVFLTSKRLDKGKNWRYFLNIFYTGYSVFVIVFFTMFQFWGC